MDTRESVWFRIQREHLALRISEFDAGFNRRMIAAEWSLDNELNVPTSTKPVKRWSGVEPHSGRGPIDIRCDIHSPHQDVAVSRSHGHRIGCNVNQHTIEVGVPVA